jgi:NitT/TauT family transport system substrate-binding protein
MKRLLAVVAALSLAACGGEASTQPETENAGGELASVRVAHVPSTLFAPLYVADAKGYFADEGVEIELQNIQAGQDAVPLAANGQVDVVVAGFSAGLFNAVDAGLDIKVVGSMGLSTGDPDASPTALEVSKELFDSGEIETVADLEGRRIAISGGPGAAGGYQLGVILAEAGLTLNDIEPVNLSFPDMAAAIENGSVAAALPPAPFTTAMEQSGVAVPLAVPPQGTVATGVIYGGEFLESAAAQPFFTALVRAAEDLQGDGAKTEEHLNILAEATGQDLEVLQEVPFYFWLPDLAPLPEQLEAQERIYLEAGLLDVDEVIPADEFVVPTFADTASEREPSS